MSIDGKVREDASPLPEEPARQDLRDSYEAPRTEIERMLARIWEDVLQLNRIGIRDNFLDLGGNSVSAVQVAASIRDALPVQLSVNDFFRHLTIVELAEELETRL